MAKFNLDRRSVDPVKLGVDRYTLIQFWYQYVQGGNIWFQQIYFVRNVDHSLWLVQIP